jgi:outer membrane receptor protein involved in Fe transport
VGTIGAVDLRPERQREIEAGTDLSLGNGRASLELTVYQKAISDLLLTRALAPSSGFGFEIFNGGKLRTRGVEVGLGLVPSNGPLNWTSRATFSMNRSRITELPVPPFIAAGFGTALGAFRIEEGASATQIVGNDTLADGTDVVRKLGDANPDFTMSFVNDFTYKALGLHFLLDWQQGAEILNLTKLLYDFGSNTADFDEPIEGSTQTVGQRRLAGFGRVASNYIESASFLKLCEITLSYDLPAGATAWLFGGVRSARLSLSGRNLFTITPYTGLDPEVSNFGNQAVGRNIDVAPYPPSRSFWLSVDVGF